MSVFEPDRDGTSDVEWRDLLARVSGNGRYHFTENQLYYAYARGRVSVTRRITRRASIGLGLIACGLSLWIYALKADLGSTLVLGILLTLGGVGCVGTGVVTRRAPAAQDAFRRLLAHWKAVEPLPLLIESPALAGGGLAYSPTDATAVVIVERELVVDLLLKNGAQDALSALIVAESGYPSALASEARRLHAERADLPVIAVHDATDAGIALGARLRASTAWPLVERRVLDAGLFPADVPQLEELAPAVPASHASLVPLDALPYDVLLRGLRGVVDGAPSLFRAITDER